MVGFREQQRSEYYNGGFVSLRDNDGMARSVSVNERTFVVEECVGKGLRMDGREAMEYRPIRLSSLNRRFCESECQVSFGASTKVLCTVRCELVPPANSMVRPNEGMLNFRVDCSPMACLSWESMAPVSTESASISNTTSSSNNSSGEEDQKWWSNRIIRTLEGLIKQGGAIDVEALCVSSGHWVWNLIVHVVILDAGGNLIDASILAAMAALRHFRLPVVETNDSIPKVWAFHDREPIPLPLHHTPFSCTFALFDLKTGGVVAAMVDPNEREEYLRYGTLTVSYHVVSDGTVAELCGLDFGGGCELSQRQISSCIDLARKQCCQLSSLLEQSLSTADQVAQQSLLQQVLSNRNNNNNNSDSPSFLDIDTNQETQEENDQDLNDEDNDDDDDGEQERYRIQALEYSSLHQAAKVKENNNEENNKSKNINSSNSLMAAMLHSASITTATSFEQEIIEDDNADTLLTTKMDEDTINPVKVKQNNNSLMSSITDTTEKTAKMHQPNSKINILQSKEEQTNTDHTKGDAINQQQLMDDSNSQHIQTEAMHKHDSNIMDFAAIDSDEEEVTTTLQSEFQPTPKPRIESNKTKSLLVKKPITVLDDNDAEDDEVDNLAMAVVTKKKKRTKSKKKK